MKVKLIEYITFLDFGFLIVDFFSYIPIQFLGPSPKGK